MASTMDCENVFARFGSLVERLNLMDIDHDEVAVRDELVHDILQCFKKKTESWDELIKRLEKVPKVIGDYAVSLPRNRSEVEWGLTNMIQQQQERYRELEKQVQSLKDENSELKIENRELKIENRQFKNENMTLRRDLADATKLDDVMQAIRDLSNVDHDGVDTGSGTVGAGDGGGKS